MKIGFFDTETTGFTKPNGEHSDQPHCCQIAALLADEDGTELQSYETIIAPGEVEPFHFIIPDRVAEIHGISTLRAIDEGVQLPEAMAKFWEIMEQADVVVAHNIDFDIIVVSAAMFRTGMDPSPFQLKERFCTMKNLTDVIRIPKTRGSGFKWPKLQECHLNFFGEGFEDAHSAMADVRAMVKVYFHAKQEGHFA